MAFVDGKWLERKERAEYLDTLKIRLRKLKALVDTGKATEYHVDLLEQDLAEYKRIERIHSCEVDVLRFFYEYFSECRNPGNPDNLVPSNTVDMTDAPPFHKELARILNIVSSRDRNKRVAWAASRGHAKSAYLSNMFPVHQICYSLRKLIIVISETGDGSKKFIRWVSNQLKYNQKLRADFGELLFEQKSRNEKASEEMFITTNGIMMASSSLGKQIRGYRNGAYRPDLIILDDLESRDSNNTPELRQKAKDWLNQDLMPAGDPDNTAVIFMGTIVHHDSLLNYVLNDETKNDFDKNRFSALLSPPERGDLWDAFENIYKTYKPSEAEVEDYRNGLITGGTLNQIAALRFFEANKAEMTKGVQVLWESRFPIQKLMLEKIAIGSKAFNTEFLNNPLDQESQVFKPEQFTYYPPDTQFTHREYIISIGIDFAMGKDNGDYSSIAVVARHKVTKKVYIVDSWTERVHPTPFIKKIVNVVMKYKPDVIAVEAQMAQEFFADTLKLELENNGYPTRQRLKYVKQRQRKQLRIEAMQPEIDSGDIVFNHRHVMLLGQLERYPNDHDDAPDAMEMAVSISKKGYANITSKPNGM